MFCIKHCSFSLVNGAECVFVSSMGEFLKLFAFFLLLSMFLETIKSDQYIMGGKKASENQFPFLTSLRFYGKWRFEHICSASIVSDRFLVTAAHCCPHYIKPHVYQIVVGAQSKESDGEIYLVEKFFVHPNYTAWPFEKVVNDIALIQLEKPITLGKNTSIIEISRKHFDGNVDAVVAGWGKNKVRMIRLNGFKFSSLTELFRFSIGRISWFEICRNDNNYK